MRAAAGKRELRREAKTAATATAVVIAMMMAVVIAMMMAMAMVAATMTIGSTHCPHTHVARARMVYYPPHIDSMKHTSITTPEQHQNESQNESLLTS